jgi:hypothetical protein
MRVLTLIFLLSFFCFSCVKKQSSDPVPVIEYKDFKAWKINGSDTAYLVIGYEDGDGDIFRDASTHGPNLVGTFYYLNSATNKFTPIFDIITQDTARITQTVLQPNPDASYKGKAVRGEMYLPWNPFRSGDSVKVFKYTLFIVDEAGNKSNVITTPEFSINF